MQRPEATGDSASLMLVPTGREGPARLLNVLLVEDNPVDAGLLLVQMEYARGDEYEFTWAKDLPAAVRLSGEERFALALLDLGLPCCSGLEAFKRFRAAAPHIPVVILTGMEDEELGVTAVELGAQDYLVKGQCTPADVSRAIRYAVTRNAAEEASRLALEHEYEVLSETLELAPVKVARIDLDLRITHANISLKQSLGDAHLEGRDLSCVLPELPRDSLKALLSRGEVISNQRVSLRLADGPEELWDLSGWPVKGKDGAIRGAIIMARDVTTQVFLERQRDDFIAKLAHDIRNPLVGTGTVLASLLEGAGGALGVRHAEILTALRNCNINLLSMLQNLLDVYRHDTGAARLVFAPVNLDQVCGTAVMNLKPYAVSRGIAIELSFADDLPPVFGDAMALQRLVTNLLHNAIKFSHTASTVSVRTGRNGNHVVVDVTDQGIGIPEGDQDSLFERFGQGAAGKSHTANAGSGLGLYLCKEIAEAHGGTITCLSAENSGTTMSLRLPTEHKLAL